MAYHEVVSRVLNLLKANNCWYETFEHEPVRTSEEAAKTRLGYTLEQGAKALIVKVKTPESANFVMLVMPANLRMSSAKVKNFFKAKEIRFATPEEVAKVTNGVQVGGV